MSLKKMLAIGVVDAWPSSARRPRLARYKHRNLFRDDDSPEEPFKVSVFK